MFRKYNDKPIAIQIIKENPLGLKVGKVFRSIRSFKSGMYQLEFLKGPNKYLHANYLKECKEVL